MFTIEYLNEQVAHFRAKTKELKAENPFMNRIEWKIEDIPYSDFEAYRQYLNKDANDNNYISKESITSNKLVYWVHPSYGECTIVFYSLPVKFRTHIEIIE